MSIVGEPLVSMSIPISRVPSNTTPSVSYTLFEPDFTSVRPMFAKRLTLPLNEDTMVALRV